ncbi:hypothetical protein Golax_023280 [Gossypium laxum]|uniref:Uncharacterized protein n=1 Tax=Gossypium laxum TaxID=34288 RepID=A0A7J9B6I2_9ROSI|nr:hypothetical protein [Gossypium laxum]
MLVGLLVGNPMRTSTRLMGCLCMNWQYLSQKVAFILRRIMTLHASFVLMVEIFCFVMDAQGRFIKNVLLCQQFLMVAGTANIARTCL